jgi:hypothetical protein
MNKAVYELRNGYELMYNESRRFLQLFREEGEMIKRRFPDAKVYEVFNENFSGGYSIELNNHTLTVYFSIPVFQSASASFLNLSIFNARFNEKGKLVNREECKDYDTCRRRQTQYNLHTYYGFLRWMEVSDKNYNYTCEQLLMNWSMEFLKYALGDSQSQIKKAA